jgi:hypothetical protein
LGIPHTKSEAQPTGEFVVYSEIASHISGFVKTKHMFCSNRNKIKDLIASVNTTNVDLSKMSDSDFYLQYLIDEINMNRQRREFKYSGDRTPPVAKARPVSTFSQFDDLSEKSITSLPPPTDNYTMEMMGGEMSSVIPETIVGPSMNLVKTQDASIVETERSNFDQLFPDTVKEPVSDVRNMSAREQIKGLNHQIGGNKNIQHVYDIMRKNGPITSPIKPHPLQGNSMINNYQQSVVNGYNNLAAYSQQPNLSLQNWMNYGRQLQMPNMGQFDPRVLQNPMDKRNLIPYIAMNNQLQQIKKMVNNPQAYATI